MEASNTVAEADATTRREYVTLNAIRGVAALAVVFYHARGLFGVIAPRGYLAVDLFFVLSGFVIAHAYEARLVAGLGRLEFCRIRLIRFYPLYAAGLAVGIARELLLIATHNSYALNPAMLAAAVATAALFLPLPLAQRDFNLFPINIPSWSLFYELLVNMLYAAARPLLTTGGLIGIILLSGTLLGLLTPVEGLGHLGVTSASFAEGGIRTIFSFTLGLLIHRLKPRAPAVPVLPLLAVTAVAMIWPYGGAAYDLIFAAVISPLLVVFGASVEPPRQWYWPAAFLGLISFPIYALHRPVLEFAEAIANRSHVPGPWIGTPTILILIIISGSLAPAFDVRARRKLSDWARTRLSRDKTETTVP